MFDAQGSPLAARQNPYIYLVVVALIIVIGIIFLIFILSKFIAKIKTSPEYIEKQKDKITTFKNVRSLSKKLSLRDYQETLLWKICKENKAKNILYNYTDENFIDEIFSSYYKTLIQTNADSKLIYELFKLRFYIYKRNLFSREISNTHKMPLDAKFLYMTKEGSVYNLKLAKNEKNGLYISLPEALYNAMHESIELLSKITLIYSEKNNVQYAIVTRVIQFTQINGEYFLLVGHSNTICAQNRRNSKRFDVNLECIFSAVDTKVVDDNKLEFTAKENTYNGTITDISVGGICLSTELPIKKDQYLNLRFSYKNEKYNVYGKIVDTRIEANSKNVILHIKFVQVPTKTKVTLLADLYEYNL